MAAYAARSAIALEAAARQADVAAERRRRERTRREELAGSYRPTVAQAERAPSRG